jgi:hypothetical protein
VDREKEVYKFGRSHRFIRIALGNSLHPQNHDVRNRHKSIAPARTDCPQVLDDYYFGVSTGQHDSFLRRRKANLYSSDGGEQCHVITARGLSNPPRGQTRVTGCLSAARTPDGANGDSRTDCCDRFFPFFCFLFLVDVRGPGVLQLGHGQPPHPIVGPHMDGRLGLCQFDRCIPSSSALSSPPQGRI